MADKTTDTKTVKKKAARSARQGTAKKATSKKAPAKQTAAAEKTASLEEQTIGQVEHEIAITPGARPEPETPSTTKAKPKRPLWQRITFRTLRIIGIWVPLSLVVLVALVLFGAWLFLSPGRVQQLAVDGFNGASYGTLDLDVKSFSPYSGFVIENIVIRNGEEFNRTEFVRIDRLVLDYSFFSIFKGDVRFSEIGIYRPRIWLVQRNGEWNAAKLMKPSEKTEEPEEEEEEEESGPSSSEINLPISVSLLFRFILDDARVYVDGETFDAELEGLTFNTDIFIPPFKRIPKSVEAVRLLERMKIELNPQQKVDLSFRSKEASVEPPLIAFLSLVFDKQADGQVNFKSSLRLGTYQTPVRFQSAHLAPLNFLVGYDLFYDPIADHLALSDLSITFKGMRWLALSGTVDGVTKDQRVDLRMQESRISLDALYPYFTALTRDYQTRFGGSISLMPLTVKGTLNAMDVDGALKLENIAFRNPDVALNLPYFILDYHLRRRGDMHRITAGINMPHMNYALGREQSGDNGLNLSLAVDASENFSYFDINSLNLQFYNPSVKRNALSLALSGKVRTAPVLKGNIKISSLVFDKEPLIPMLPEGLQASLGGLPFKKPVVAALGADFTLGTAATVADLDLALAVPDFNVNDLRLLAGITQHNNAAKRIDVRRLHLSSVSRGITLTAGGYVEMAKAPLSDSDLKLNLRIAYPQMVEVYAPWKLQGAVVLDARMKGDLETGGVTGSLNINDLYAKNDESKLAVNKVNLAFPFEYSFKTATNLQSRIAVDKSRLIDNEQFRDKVNFTIESVYAKHPARDLSFQYLKDFKSVMFFRNNAFEIVRLEGSVLDGTVYGRDILFNLADLKSGNMEYRLVLDVTNVDINRLDDIDGTQEKTRDAELSLNADISGKGLDFSKGMNVTGPINIYKVGDKIANRLFKALSEEEGESKLGFIQIIVDNSVTLKSFNYYIDKGNMYTTVKLEKNGVVGYIAGIREDTIQFDRIPLQEYLRKVREGE